jgi:hypothetical protein
VGLSDSVHYSLLIQLNQLLTLHTLTWKPGVETAIFTPLMAMYHSLCKYKGSELLTAVIMKNTILWNVTPYSLVEVQWHLGATYCFNLQGLDLQLWLCLLVTACWIPASIILQSCRSQYVAPKCRYASTGARNVTSQMLAFFMYMCNVCLLDTELAGNITHINLHHITTDSYFRFFCRDNSNLF